MEQREENIPQIDQPETNGSSTAVKAESRFESATRTSVAAYEKARAELQQAVGKLRAEVEQVDLAQARLRARNWVRENPELASLLAVGGGLLLGRLLSAALTPAPPPPLSARLKSRADLLAGQAHRLAEDVAAAVASGALFAGGKVARTAHVVSEHAQDVGEALSRRAVEAAEIASRNAADLGEQLADRARSVGQSAAHLAESTAHSVGKSAGKLERRINKGARGSAHYAESAFDAARTFVAADLVRRMNKWLKKTF